MSAIQKMLEGREVTPDQIAGKTVRAFGEHFGMCEVISFATMSYMLRNVVYLGRAHLAGVSVQAHEPIVAPVVFYKAGQLLTARNKRGGKRGAELRALELRLGARSRVGTVPPEVAAS